MEKPKMTIDEVGSKRWELNGKLHREDGPALEHTNGNKYWLFDGAMHRDNGPAFETTDGHKAWYEHGRLHRLNGPAIKNDSHTVWYIHGKRFSSEEEFIRYKQLSFLEG